MSGIFGAIQDRQFWQDVGQNVQRPHAILAEQLSSFGALP